MFHAVCSLLFGCALASVHPGSLSFHIGEQFSPTPSLTAPTAVAAPQDREKAAETPAPASATADLPVLGLAAGTNARPVAPAATGRSLAADLDPGQPSPEPGAFLLVGTGLLGLALTRRWRRARAAAL